MIQPVLSFPVNSVCWAPHDYGLILACGSSDGAISLLSYTGDGQWEVKKISNAHTVSLHPGSSMGVFVHLSAQAGASESCRSGKYWNTIK